MVAGDIDMTDDVEAAKCTVRSEQACLHDREEYCVLKQAHHGKQPAGAIVGAWAVAFKIYMIGAPVCIFLVTAIALPWVRWITENQFDRELRLTTSQATLDRFGESLLAVTTEMKEVRVTEAAAVAALNAKISTMPPQEWRERIIALENNADDEADAMQRVLLDLELIKFKLGIGKVDEGGNSQ